MVVESVRLNHAALECLAHAVEHPALQLLKLGNIEDLAAPLDSLGESVISKTKLGHWADGVIDCKGVFFLHVVLRLYSPSVDIISVTRVVVVGNTLLKKGSLACGALLRGVARACVDPFK